MSSVVSQDPPHALTVDEFLTWSEDNPGRHELVRGQICAMAPGRIGHADAKFAAQAALKRAIGQAGVPCVMLPHGVMVRIDRKSAYQPDALVYCGKRLEPDAVEVRTPVIVVEVLSPSAGFYDRPQKLTGYFSVVSIQHYLIVYIDRHMVVHHSRNSDICIVSSGLLRLDPSGLDLTVADLLGEA